MRSKAIGSGQPRVDTRSRTAGTVRNEEIAAAFEEMAELLAISGENPFRIRAYRRAAQVIGTLPRSLAEIADPAALQKLPGIGEDLASKIIELLRTGRLGALQRLRAKVPPGLRELLQLPGLGPARVRGLYAGLGVRNRADLDRALQQGRIEGLRGFGPALRARLRKDLASVPAGPQRWTWSVATQYAEPLRQHLQSVPGMESVDVAGSYRRGRDTVGDLDLVCVGRGVDLAAALRAHADVRELQASGPTRCTATLRNGMQADVRLVGPASAGAALYYFTGSRDHNVQLRARALARGMKLNEYGLFRGTRRLAGENERGILEALGLAWIPPELREQRGEIEAAERGAIPHLIERSDLLGDLHAHTLASDGHDTLRAMAQAARALGLRYLAITDHSRHLGVVHGLDPERLARQAEEIDALNATLSDLHVLKGTEVDILEDGRLALPDDALRRLDVVIAAVHGHFELSEARQTARILRALDNPYVSILAHPTGRLLNERPPCAIDLGRILDQARQRPCFVELNAQPMRLDLDEAWCRAARDRGVLVSIASDAHASAEFADLDGGIRQARRGWLRRADVLNARPLTELRKLLARTRLN